MEAAWDYMVFFLEKYCRELDEYRGMWNWKTNWDISSKKNWKVSSSKWELRQQRWVAFVGKLFTATMLPTPEFVVWFPVFGSPSSNSSGRDGVKIPQQGWDIDQK